MLTIPANIKDHTNLTNKFLLKVNLKNNGLNALFTSLLSEKF